MFGGSGELKRRWIVLFVLLLPLLGLAANVGGFPFPAGSEFSDFTVSHYPNAVFLQQSILKHGEVPFWSNTILSGYPFAANPLSGLWYPPGWTAFMLPQPAGLNLLVMVHLLWGGLGMYRLLLCSGVNFIPALAGAVVFFVAPKTFAHLAAGHVTLLYAVAWTPWLLLTETRQRSWPLAGPVLGLILLADVRWAIPAGMIWIAWKVYRSVTGQQETGTQRQTIDWKRYALSAGASLIVAVMIAAPLLILLGEYTPLSTRAALTHDEQLNLALPPEKLIGLLAPDFSAYVEWVTYFGALPLILLIISLAVPAVRKKAAFWIGVLVVSFLISLGPVVPGLDLLWRIPGFSLLRVPSRLLFLGEIAFGFIVAYSLDHLIERRSLPRFDPVFWLVPLVVFAWFWTIGLWYLSSEISIEFLWGAAALTIGLVLIAVRRRTNLSTRTWVGLVIVVLIIELCGVGYQNLRFEPADSVFSAGQGVTAVFDPEGQYRVYSPSYSIPQHIAARSGLELADGVDPLQLSAYAAFMESATGIEFDGYSVTLPPDPLEPVEENPARAQPDAAKLGLLNVRYLVADYPLHSPDLTLIQQWDGRYVYENQKALPRAWVQPDDAAVSLGADSLPEITRWSPNRIEMQIDGPGRLVLSEVMYPGWRAWVDGREDSIEPVEGLLRSVMIPNGRHDVRFQFFPRGLYVGILLSILGWAAVIAVLWFTDRRSGLQTAEARHADS